MAWKKFFIIYRSCLLKPAMRILSIIGLTLYLNPISYAQAIDNFGQTVQIYTHFSEIIGKPSWLLVIYDVDTNQVLPYMFDITELDNFWVAFSFSRNYRIAASTLRFFPFPTSIHNFCHLEDGVVSGQSFYVTLSGPLTPNRRLIHCQVMRYPNSQFTIVPS
ncbi:MAG: hypothetical protein A3E83_02410 [Gammaproteobacteria bacterium RIFCSPHIGHO2_12_FULL_41_20]|nr:MAG: hypothetical protein A3E83_02410 [Gammaproteobacteria bacterium RIFCSPHIGHO2_12_FULL_41_20]